MGDLISKNALKKALSEKYSGLADARDEEQFALYSVYKQIVRVIEAQPTAYSVEKVVAELEERSYQEAVDDMDAWSDIPSMVVSLKTAIGCVRNGGKE